LRLVRRPSKPLVPAPRGVGGHAKAYSRNFRPHADHFWFIHRHTLARLNRQAPIDYEVKNCADHVLAVLNISMISGES